MLAKPGFIPAAGVLSGRNGNVARMFLESLWRAVVDEATSAAGGKHSGGKLTELRDALRDAFGRSPSRPLYVQTLQGFAIVDRGSWVKPADLAAAATASGSLQAGALQVCESLHWASCHKESTRLLVDAMLHAHRQQPVEVVDEYIRIVILRWHAEETSCVSGFSLDQGLPHGYALTRPVL